MSHQAGDAAVPATRALLAVAAVIFAALAVAPMQPGLGLGVQLALCAPLIAAFGLPHGATDWQVANLVLRPRLGQGWALGFAAFYATGMALVTWAAWAAPHAALLGFIAVGIWHFGAEDAGAHGLGGSRLAVLAFGIPPVAAPALFWPAQTGVLLRNLGIAGGPAPTYLAGAAMAAWLFAAGATMLRHPAARRAIVLELGCLVALQAACPPLPAFAAYFCLIHGPRHMASLPALPPSRAVQAASGVATVVIGLAAGGAAVWTGAGAGWATINAVFWGLAALTLPHVVFGRLAARLAAAPAEPGFTSLHVMTRAAGRI
jgi:Brp/Blh family beta-carotene 15,15'-monooxygenase